MSQAAGSSFADLSPLRGHNPPLGGQPAHEAEVGQGDGRLLEVHRRAVGRVVRLDALDVERGDREVKILHVEWKGLQLVLFGDREGEAQPAL